MGIQKASGTNVYATISAPADGDALIDALETHLVTAGWSIASGGGTSAVVFQTAATANGSYAMRITTSISSGILLLKFSKGDGTGAQSNFFAALNPDGVSDWYVLANQFGFVLFEASSLGTSSARKFCFCSLLFVPSTIAGDSSLQALCMGDCLNTSGTARNSLRDRTCASSTTFAMFLAHTNGSSYENYNNNESAGKGRPRWTNIDTVQRVSTYPMDEKWFNGHYAFYGAEVNFHTTQEGAGRLQGTVFDMVLMVGNNLSERAEFTFDGDTFVTIGGRGTLTDNTDGQPAWTLGFLKPAA